MPMPFEHLAIKPDKELLRRNAGKPQQFSNPSHTNIADLPSRHFQPFGLIEFAQHWSEICTMPRKY